MLLSIIVIYTDQSNMKMEEYYSEQAGSFANSSYQFVMTFITITNSTEFSKDP